MEGNVGHNDSGRSAPEFHVVGIGASAGGLESLERFFGRVPADSGMAFVVLQHLSPDFKSLMDELLARRTTMPVRQAEDGMPLEANAVYLLPPMKEMVVNDRRLLLSDKDPRHGLALPIDIFFRSLAKDVGDRAIAVVLSGSGSDGSRGVQEVSKAGGLVFCESAETAKFNGMPLSAVRTGVVDRVLSPEEIAEAIGSLGRGAPSLSVVDEASPSDASVDAILRLLRDEYAIDFSHYKASTVVRRIERRLALNRSIDIDTYIEQLRSDPRELNSLYEDLLIGVTRFFRDEDAFAVLEQRVVPDIIARSKPDDPDDQIRVWVSGCATGHEAYSIAILFHEQLIAERRPVNIKILATDVHKASLDVASAGIYTAQQLAGVSPERLERFFTRKPNGYHISQNLRECIVFAPHNVIRDAPFTKLDLIACRNMLIYLQPHAQKTVLALFHFALKSGGYLFMGSSESPGGLVDEFDTIDEHAKVYRKRRDIGLPRDLKLPLPRTASATSLSGSATVRAGVHPQLLTTYDQLLDRFMPPSFLIDERGVLVDTYGGVESLLRVKKRRPSQLLLDMLDDQMRTLVSGAVSRVRRDMEAVRFAGLSISGVGSNTEIAAEPVCDVHGTLTHILIMLVQHGSDVLHTSTGAQAAPASVVADRGASEMVDVAGMSRHQVQNLQDELSYTKENLQAAIQELETTNEELQATNEELVASNEELQSTNEELHSVNEELYTVNAEYQKKNVELQEVNDDVEHLLNGTDVATLFLDRALCIRKFTPRIADIFHVIPNDVGRPLRSFRHDLAYPELLADIERVLREGVTIEAQAWDGQGRCYFLRVLPYRAHPRERADQPTWTGEPVDATKAPDGVVLTLTDISALEQARARLAQLSAIVESSEDAITSETLDGVITSWNNGAMRHFGFSADEAIGRHSSFLCPPDLKQEIEDVLSYVRNGRPVERHETRRRRKDGAIVNVSVTYSPILDSDNRIVGVSSISRDITQLVAARQEIADREERIHLLLDSTAEAIYGIDLSGVCIFCNSACARTLGYESPVALIGKQMHPLLHHTRPDGTPYPAEQSPVFDSMRNREAAHVDCEVLWRADGSSFPAEYWSHPIVRGDEVIGAVVTFLDITERRQAEAELQEGVRRREQFLAMLSHELRNPLAAILSATHLLSSEAVTPNISEYAGRIVERQARHMSRLLDDLLDVSRITHGRIVLRKEAVDLRDTARSAIEALGPLMVEHRTQLIVDITDEPVPVIGDPARLQQIQANLLSNASKYSSNGGEVRFEIRRVADEAMIRVSDHGRGIEPEMLPRIFDLFVQGDRSLARPDGGLGIGLTLLRSLVELHDGRVEAHSDGAWKGSVFTVFLPIATAAYRAADTSRTPRVTAVRTVVVVEDQDDAREMMKILLETKGLTVHVAADGREGADLIGRVQPDLALVDLGLPVVSGYDLARTLRGSGAAPHTRLVALSGYGQDADVQAALDAGFDQHLTKPPDFQKLDALLQPPEDSCDDGSA